MNPWEYKPWWCQPWSILLTGVIVIGSTWQLSQRLWLTMVVSLPILLWWYYFLLIWPQAIREYYGSQKTENKETEV